MSDPTKKSIVINKSFLSGIDNSSNIQNKKSKKNTRNLSEEIIKPNKLKKMLLDKINAKRKADQTSSPSLISGGAINSKDTLDISKETKLFSSEFKKSLDFLDNYIGQKRNDKYKTKTLKKQNSSVSTSLNNDILKSIHNNNNNNNNVTNPHALYPPNNINQSIQTQAYIPQHIQPVSASTSTYVQAPAQVMQSVANISPQQRHQPAPFFQKIQLQIPSKSPQSITPSIVTNTVPKINLAIGKTANQSLVYTELPPELQNFTPPVYSISSPSVSPMPMEQLPPLESHTNFVVDTSRVGIGSREMDKFENSNSELIDEDIYTTEDMSDDVEMSKTSLLPSSSTFSPIKLSDDAPYGCLKGGSKPTFRTYNKTIKNNIRFSENENDSDNIYSDRQTKLKELQNKHSKKMSTSSQDNKQINSDNNENDTDDVEGDSGEHKNKHSLRKTKVRRHLRKTITKKFKLGKQQGNIVGVLIKNNDTRKNIQKEHGLLKSKQLADVKKYLVEKNLIKIGSTAPPGVIRNIYEASMLAGEVENVGKGIGLHNFLEDKKSW
jgi:hypothetical protein